MQPYTVYRSLHVVRSPHPQLWDGNLGGGSAAIFPVYTVYYAYNKINHIQNDIPMADHKQDIPFFGDFYIFLRRVGEVNNGGSHGDVFPNDDWLCVLFLLLSFLLSFLLSSLLSILLLQQDHTSSHSTLWWPQVAYKQVYTFCRLLKH